MNRILLLGLVMPLAFGAGCSNGNASGDDPIDIPDEPVAGVEDECGSVRLTSYDAGNSGWCEFRNDHEILPDFVKQNLTLAIAEPYGGSSYEGEFGEACGECWEVSTIDATEIVMVNNLCPIKGNPLCAGGHFHFDLSQESAEALSGGGLTEAEVRRVPCPVNGDIHVQVNDRNEWGYLRVAFVNHRFPIRTAEFRAADEESWHAIERSGGAWHVQDDGEAFAEEGPGGVFRFTSAAGEVAEGTAVLRYDVKVDSVFATGAQFEEGEPEAPSCSFEPPADVYDDAWGGIDQVRWEPNPWSGVKMKETQEGCDDGASCVHVRSLDQWSGFHIYYRQQFPVATFERLSLRVRTLEGSSRLAIAANSFEEDEACEDTEFDVDDEWMRVEIDLAETCGAMESLNAITAKNLGEDTELLVDAIRFE